MKLGIIVLWRIKPLLLLLEARHDSLRMTKTWIIDNSKIFMSFLNLFALVINNFVTKIKYV